jgi:hypothetical protein
MTTTEFVERPVARAADPYDTRLRRFGLAAGAFLGPWFILACNAGFAMAQADGVSAPLLWPPPRRTPPCCTASCCSA